MKKIVSFTVFVLLVVMIFDACQKDSTEPEIPIVPTTPDNDTVSVNLDSVPYTNLSQYRFFTGDMKNNTPNDGVIQYQPASGLFTDYAHKKRFVWVPAGMKGTYVADNNIIDFPVGTALIKTFYYDHVQPDNVTKIIETRVMIRKSNEWIFAEYVWNEDQT